MTSQIDEQTIDADQVNFNFENSFARDLEGFFVHCEASTAPDPQLLLFNKPLAEELHLKASNLHTTVGAEIFSGNKPPEGAMPLAQVYAGHQFGNFSPQLGDGRALLLGEIIDKAGVRQDIQLKGSGQTPFSRRGDGKAALGPVLREYLISEAMHALGVPTTRSLAAVSTGEKVFRETPLPGAVLTRVASSHLRVGTFEFFAARREFDKVRRLADYAIARHYPEVADAENPFLAFFKSVAHSQLSLVARWMSIGFIHGVMNTDNTAISGQTIDYGPCAFMDKFSPKTVFSSIDTQGRYAYGNQPSILIWNLCRLAETLIPHIDDNKDRAVEILTDEIKGYENEFKSIWLNLMRRKIGLNNEEEGDLKLIQALLNAMEESEADFTLTFRRLSRAISGDSLGTRNLFVNPTSYDSWERDWFARLERETISKECRSATMDQVNPVYIPRNHKVEEALSFAVEEGDLSAFEKILSIVIKPFDEVAGQESYAEPAPETDIPYRTFCGT
ncbi:MAG: YdiU family protein [Pseudomonadota bacterium]|nr:YdiU family protein [Pseudomonadota bacterium]